MSGAISRPIPELPGALGDCELVPRLAAARPAVFLDYDGTLTPIVDRPGDAVMSDGMRDAVRALQERCTVCVVTGRDLPVIRDLLRLDGMTIAAGHGFDVWSPTAGAIHRQASAEDRRLIHEVEQCLRADLEGIPGVLVEPKASSVAAHVRLVAPAQRPSVAAVVDRVVAAHPGRLRVTPGKMVHEVQPAVDWDKGRAVLHLLAELGLDRAGTVPVYLGDDVTDEDAFAVVADRGVGIIVARPGDPEVGDRETRATHRLDSVDQVREFLVRLASELPPE